MSASQAGIGLTYNGGGTTPNIAFQRGGSILGDTNKFLKKTHLVSHAASIGDALDVPGAKALKKASKLTGYGKKRKTKKSKK